jgi:hypothetical protein
MGLMLARDRARERGRRRLPDLLPIIVTTREVCFFAPISGRRKRELLVSQKKQSLDYTTGTYFIHPSIIEEMRQKQHQKRQLVIEQGKEQQPADPAKQAAPIVLDLPDTTLSQTAQN